MSRKIEYILTTSQIRKIKHCIGFDGSKVKGIKYRTMKSYRNYYTTAGINEELDDLVKQGIMERRDYPRGVGTDPKIYRVSKYGYDVLSEITEIKITEME
jgi:hypothetical protein